MRRIAYVNGVYLPANASALSVQERGFLFGDGIYEVWAVRAGKLFDNAAHLARLKRSLQEALIAAPMSEAALMAVIGETLRRNGVRDGIVYLQITRGAAPRDHGFPPSGTKPTVVVTASSISPRLSDARAEKGVAVITLPEARWARCDIKTVNLLPNVLAKQQAREAGAFEAWFVDSDGFVTEGASTTAWIVDAQGRIRTRDLSNRILHGVTRAAILQLARQRQMSVVESPFTPDEAKAAREAFLTAAGTQLCPVISIDGARIGDGEPGPAAKALRQLYFASQC
ncbi:MAG: D-amino-acid transaminase [Hyphomonadaceae bacterium]|nr:D-amino-acid transaminase [Hyphomonadaceae bacterium]